MDTRLDDRLDALVAEYADRLAAGAQPRRGDYLEKVPAAARPGLERCLKLLDAGLAQAPERGLALVPGLRVGGFELVRELGRGGMARVWLARDLELERPVALKILRPGLALEARHAERFRREALAIARLRHPGAVQIHRVGEDRGLHFLAMEYVAGPSLATVLEALPAQGPRTAEQLARASGVGALARHGQTYEQALALLLEPVALALAAAHAAGLLHRDVKPSNILIHPDGRALLADFGLAKADGDEGLSLTGDALGTPHYMSPEQARVSGQRVDHRTDIWSLGVTLYEALCGRRPFDGEGFLGVLEAIRTQEPASLRALAPWISRDAAAVVRRAMARDPQDRYGSAQALGQDLAALGEARTPSARTLEGGGLRRGLGLLRRVVSAQPFEYRSARTLFGLPLLHIHTGRRHAGQRARTARGWIALGERAQGVIFASGGIAVGGIAIGGLSLGIISWGGLAAGLLFAFGGLAAALYSFAGIALGWIALGGVAIGQGAIGGLAIGEYAIGGAAVARYAVDGASREDPEAIEWLDRRLPWKVEARDPIPWLDRGHGLPVQR